MNRPTPWLALLVLLLAACDRSEPERPAVAAAAPPAALAASAAPAPREEPAAQSVAPPASGGGVTLESSGAALSDLLKRLGRTQGFRVDGSPSDDRSVSVQFEDAPIEDVLSELLAGEAYALHYSVDAETGEHRLSVLIIGSLEDELDRLRRVRRMARVRNAKQARKARRAQAQASRPTPEERAERARQRAIEREERGRAIAEALAAADAETRADGVRMLDAEEAAEQLGKLALDDPAPEVRTAAVEQLGNVDGSAASGVIYQTLGDPDPRVALAALDACAFRMDPGCLPHIEPLYDHADPEVSQSARDTGDFLAP